MNCNKCVFNTGRVPGSSHHIGCGNILANVVVNKHGFDNGWVLYPINFDQIWIKSCDGYSEKEEDKEKCIDSYLNSMLRYKKGQVKFE